MQNCEISHLTRITGAQINIKRTQGARKKFMLMAKSRKAPKILFGRESFTRNEMVKDVSEVKELKSRKPNSLKPSILESHHEVL